MSCTVNRPDPVELCVRVDCSDIGIFEAAHDRATQEPGRSVAVEDLGADLGYGELGGHWDSGLLGGRAADSAPHLPSRPARVEKPVRKDRGVRHVPPHDVAPCRVRSAGLAGGPRRSHVFEARSAEIADVAAAVGACWAQWASVVTASFRATASMEVAMTFSGGRSLAAMIRAAPSWVSLLRGDLPPSSRSDGGRAPSIRVRAENAAIAGLGLHDGAACGALPEVLTRSDGDTCHGSRPARRAADHGVQIATGLELIRECTLSVIDAQPAGGPPSPS